VDEQKASIMSHGEYLNRPLLVFGEPGTQYPFSFGQRKAGLLLQAMTEVGGAEQFKKVLETFVAEKIVSKGGAK
jgi:hypothetical protein